MRRGDWIGYLQMRRWGVGAYDAADRKMSWVTRCRHIAGGIRVELVALVNGDDTGTRLGPAVECGLESRLRVVTATCTIEGGTIRLNPQQATHRATRAQRNKQ
jgi:hypothetical protein